MKTRNYKVLGMLALPVAALAVAAVLLSMNLGASKQTSADSPHAAGLEYSIAVGGCNSVGDAKGNCTVGLGSTFNVVVSLDDISGIGNASYDALAVTVDYTGVTSKGNPDITWSGCVFEAPNSGVGFENAGCAGGIGAAPSTVRGPVFDADFNCAAAGTVSIRHGAADTLVIDSKGVTHSEAGPDVLNINCAASTATNTPAPTPTPPPIPRMFKDCSAEVGIQSLCNVFLTRQGAKIPPVRCEDSTNVIALNEKINIPITTINPKGDLQDLASFEFEVRFDSKKVCVNLLPEQQWVDAGAVCLVRDKDSSTLEGIAQIGCVTIGKGVDTDGLYLATIEVRPQPELYSVIRPNQDNGQVVQILNQNCELADEQGMPIPIFSCEDADITFRFLEGDVDGPDCDVDVFDTQQVAFRWGANKGSLLFNSFMDLEPSGHGVNGDGDIDIKDIQFVFGRFGSQGIAQKVAKGVSGGVCTGDGTTIWPPQPPANPKA